MKKGIIFDLDGTLWDPVELITFSWQKVANKFELDTKLTTKAVKDCMGLPMDEIFARLFPDVDENFRKILQKECEEYENEYISQQEAPLFLYVEEVLKELKNKNFNLYIVTNSQDGYVPAFLKASKLGYLFDDYEMFGRTKRLKADNIKSVFERNKLDLAVYLGDTQGDFDATTQVGLPFVFAEYGFGCANNAKYRIQSIKELPDIVDKIL